MENQEKLYSKKGKLKRKYYEMELARLQEELVKLQYWIKNRNLKVCVVFEGRDAAGALAAPLNGQPFSQLRQPRARYGRTVGSLQTGGC